MTQKRKLSNSNIISLSQEQKKMTATQSYSTPTDFLLHAFKENGYSREDVTTEARSKLIKLTPDMVEAYNMEVSKAARDDDLETLKALYNAGALSDCCNKFGDSLVHIACRRGHTRILKFLVEEAKFSVHRVDDLQRTPLHDACWTPTPNFEIVDILLRAAPEQGLCADNRGFTPFEYARAQHRDEWLSFLSQRRSMMILN